MTTPQDDIHPMWRRHCLFDEDRAELDEYVTNRLEAIEQERRDLLAVAKDLAALPDVTLADMDCPVCGSRAVRELRPLYALGRRLIHHFHGGWVLDPRRRTCGNGYSIADALECSICHGFLVVEEHTLPTAAWTLDTVSEKSTGLAAVLLRELPHLEEVRWYCVANEWHVRVGLDTWWCYSGPKDTILHNLMLDRRARRKRWA